MLSLHIFSATHFETPLLDLARVNVSLVTTSKTRNFLGKLGS